MKLDKTQITFTGTALAVLITTGLGSLVVQTRFAQADNTGPPAPAATLAEMYGKDLSGPAVDEWQPSVERLYEIVEREADGTTVIRTDFIIDEVQTRTRTTVHDGQIVQQVYDVVTPVRETVTVRVPPGKNIFGYLQALYEQRLEAGQPMAKAPVVTRVAEEQFEEVLFNVIEPEADGPATVAIDYLVFKPQLVNRQLRRDGKYVEQISVVPITETRVHTTEVRNDVIALINKSPQIVEPLRKILYARNHQMPPSEMVFEVLGQRPDGTTLVQYESIDFDVETRTQEVVRDGKSVEQVYEIEIPVRRLQTFELRAGEDIRDFLRKACSLEDATAVEVPTGPADDDDFPPPPPAPVVDPDA